jgi:hypothetical protein
MVSGDVNGDGVVDILDVLLLVKAILGGVTLSAEELDRADVNADDSINLLDIIAIVDIMIYA